MKNPNNLVMIFYPTHVTLNFRQIIAQYWLQNLSASYSENSAFLRKVCLDFSIVIGHLHVENSVRKDCQDCHIIFMATDAENTSF